MSELQQDIATRIRILIVDEDPGSAELMVARLADEGFVCNRISSGRTALEWLASNHPDLIILGCSLGDMGAAAFVEGMRESGREIPFIMVTGVNDVSLALEMMACGAYDYMVRDDSFPERLPALVKRALHEAEIHERLRIAELSLRQSEMRLARAQKIARMGSWEFDLVTGELYLSEEMHRIFGLNSNGSANVGMKWIMRRVNRLDRANLRRMFFSAARSRQPFKVSCRIDSIDNRNVVVNSQGEVELSADGRARLISGTTQDITASVQAESEIQQLINYDTLTGLPNRNLLHNRLTLTIAQANREKHLVGVLYLDLDRFKGVNEPLGHRVGDKLLRAVAERLAACVRESDTLARLGGDEFVIVLGGVHNVENITIVAKKILGIVSEPIFIEAHEIYTTASIGIAVYPMDGEDSHTLLNHSDLAMYQAKEHDRNNFQFFSAEMNIKVLERMMLESSMRKALEREEFFLVYQPQVEALSGRIIGMEALLRWNNPELGLVGPDKFIALAEDTGFIIPIGEWVLLTACRQNKAWQDQGLPPVRMSVNLSAKQFSQKGLDEMVSAVLMEAGLDPQLLELEITESAIMKNSEHSIAVMGRLREMGITLAIDDFGTGYSSLSYLKHFPVSRLKIDRSFVRDITTNADDAAIAEIIIAMAKTLKLSVIAEGVETRSQMDFLSFHSCEAMQGYLFSRPVPADQFAQLLRNGLSY